MSPEHPLAIAAGALKRDVFLFNGTIQRGDDLDIIEKIGATQTSREAILLLVTNGGDPDAAYKISRYLQERYDHFTVLIPGLCKSAGTLLALGAHELAFTPYGELGPLDIQMSKIDKFEQAQSGLVITDSLNTLESRALEIFLKTTADLVSQNQGMISFASASHAAVEAMRAIYSPVLEHIDPEEIGVRSRAMRIAQDYGRRLAAKSRNLKKDTLRLLAETYSSHSFVIDKHEAENLFERVRSATEVEKQVISMLGQMARFQGHSVQFHALHADPAASSEDVAHDQSTSQDPGAGDGGDPEGTAAPSVASAAPHEGVVHILDFVGAEERPTRHA